MDEAENEQIQVTCFINSYGRWFETRAQARPNPKPLFSLHLGALGKESGSCAARVEDALGIQRLDAAFDDYFFSWWLKGMKKMSVGCKVPGLNYGLRVVPFPKVDGREEPHVL